MKGYSFKIGGEFINYSDDKQKLERQLERMGYTNYKRPGSRVADNWVDSDKIGSSPHWGLNDRYGKVVLVEINEIVDDNNVIPDDIKCCEITIKQSGTVIYLTDFVTVSRIFGYDDKLDFHYLRTYTDTGMAGTRAEEAHLDKRTFMHSIRKTISDPIKFKDIIDKETASLHPFEIRQLHFSDLPEKIQNVFREFESSNLRIDAVAQFKQFKTLI